MPIVNGEEVLNVTANQLDEILSNIGYGSISYATLQPTPNFLLSSIPVPPSSELNSVGIFTGNNAKMSVTFSQTGLSTDCTLYIYGSDSDDLSLPGNISISTVGYNAQPLRFAIASYAIPAYTFCKCINNDPSNSAICTVKITTWQ